MDDISRELPPDSTGAIPVSERQKGPEELQRFELGHIGEETGASPSFGDRITGMGVNFLADRLLQVNNPADKMSGDEPSGGGEPTDVHADIEPGDAEPGDIQPGDVEPGDIEPGDAEPVRAEPAQDQGLEAGADHEQVPETPSSEAAPGPQVDAPEAGLEGAEQSEEASEIADLPAEGEASERTEESADVDPGAAEAAVAAEAGTINLDSLDDLIDSELGEDGLPIVPELKEPREIGRMIYVLMMTSREGMTVFRLAQACNTTQKLVEEGLALLQEQLQSLGLPVELTRVGDTVRWMSTAAAFPYLQRLRGVKKLEKLSPAALETLAVIAYRQPVMRSEIEAIRGVKAGPMLRTLLQHKLVSIAGRADVPGRPLQYGTTQQFLERFALASLQDLPSVKEWKNLG